MVYCCVPLCKSDKGKPKCKGVSFHEIPSENELRKKWLDVISREGVKKGSEWIPSDHSVVCSLHFRLEDYKENIKIRKLKPGAVPSVFLQYPTYKQPKESKSRKRRKVSGSTEIQILNSISDNQRSLDTVTVKCEDTDEGDIMDVKMEHHLDPLKHHLDPWEHHLDPLEHHLDPLTFPVLERKVKELEEAEYHNDDNLDISPGDYDHLNMKVEESCMEPLKTEKKVEEICMEQLKTEKKGPHLRCPTCGKTFTRKSKLITHQVVHSGERPYMCDICNKTYTQKCHLKTHQLVHSGKCPYVCDVCKKKFARKSILDEHQVVHSGERPYTCDVCNKTFTQRCHLRTHHQVVHSVQHPYMCCVCKKRFTQKSCLTRHELLHSGQRPYMCDVCNKNFTQKYHLKTHYQMVHGGQRPYMCEICNKSFIQRSHLKTHQVVHSCQCPYMCGVCNKKFVYKNSFKRHQVVHCQ